MTRLVIWTISALLSASAAASAATPEAVCQSSKLRALGKRELCLKRERAKPLQGKQADFAKCEEKFQRAILIADAKAAKKDTACRWLDEGDLTATDLNTGLQWQLKSGTFTSIVACSDVATCPDPHGVNNGYTWSASSPFDVSNGTAFTVLLYQLNGGTSPDGAATTGCLSQKCDWRVPTIDELSTIVEPPFPDCGSPPCSAIPGLTVPSNHWSSSTSANSPDLAWNVYFGSGEVSEVNKAGLTYARAVRGP